MIAFIAGNLGTILVGAVILAVVVAIGISLIRKRRSGKIRQLRMRLQRMPQRLHMPQAMK